MFHHQPSLTVLHRTKPYNNLVITGSYLEEPYRYRIIPWWNWPLPYNFYGAYKVFHAQPCSFCPIPAETLASPWCNLIITIKTPSWPHTLKRQWVTRKLKLVILRWNGVVLDGLSFFFQPCTTVAWTLYVRPGLKELNLWRKKTRSVYNLYWCHRSHYNTNVLDNHHGLYGCMGYMVAIDMCDILNIGFFYLSALFHNVLSWKTWPTNPW